MSTRIRTSVVVVHEKHVLGFRAEDPSSKENFVFLPGGLVEPGETHELSAVRETLEETGYKIGLILQTPVIRRYLFEWDGKMRECETSFFAGRLIDKKPLVVNDATYHKGVIWIPLEKVTAVFSYHKDILEPIQQLVLYCE